MSLRRRRGCFALATALLCAGSAAAQSSPNASATLLRVIDTSRFVPPSPDPSGITYLWGLGTLLVSDGEVDEMGIFAGANLFEVDTSGSLIDTGVSLPESDEPIGAAYDPRTGHLFLSDDTGTREIFEFDPGPDGRFGSNDDVLVTSFATGGFGSSDPEGLAFDWIGRRLFVIDGVGRRVYRLEPGANGVFDSGDVTAVIDVGRLGAQDPEGGEFDVATGTLLVLSKATSIVHQLTPDGALLRTIDLSAGSPRRPAGLALGPRPDSFGVQHLWVVNRGTDNDSNPNENDGKLFEYSFPPLAGNRAPVVTAELFPASVPVGQSVSLEGLAVDDGLPANARLQTTWRQLSGPAAASIASPGALYTTASFPKGGTYRLALEAHDGALATAAEVSVVVTGGSGGGASGSAQVRIAVSRDDVEESGSGSISTSSSDLDLTDGQVIGLRFPNLDVPSGATVTRAFVQFQADETSSASTTLVLRAEQVDHAPPFTTTRYDVTRRTTSATSVAWNVQPWSTTGEAGPRQQTPDLALIVQEVVGRPGWAAGNALVLTITARGMRTARSFDGRPAGAPLLVVEYDPGGDPPPPPNQAPAVDAGASQTLWLPETTATLAGSASDDGVPNPDLVLLWSQNGGPPGVAFSARTAAATEVTFPGVGSYVFELSADDGELVSRDETTVTVQAPSASQTFEAAVATSLDDAEEASGGGMRLVSTDLDLVYDKGNQIVGMRFTGVPIPRDARVTRAWVQFVVDEPSSDPTSLAVFGQAADNAAQFGSTTRNISTRPRTTASVSWFPPIWPTTGAAAADQRTPDLSPIVQEIVGRAGWSPGNALVILVSGQGLRLAESSDGKVGAAPRLHVEYSDGP